MLTAKTRYNQGAMVGQLAAVYEQSVLRPLEPLALLEHQRVRLTLEELGAPLSRESSEPVNTRREELGWLAKESGPLAGAAARRSTAGARHPARLGSSAVEIAPDAFDGRDGLAFKKRVACRQQGVRRPRSISVPVVSIRAALRRRAR